MLGYPEHLGLRDQNEPVFVAADGLRPDAPDAGDVDDEIGLCHHTVQFERGPVREEIGDVTRDFAGNQVGASNMLGGPAQFKGNEVVEAGLQTRNETALLCFVNEVSSRACREVSNGLNVRQGKSSPALFI